jgi:hypothetical protein
MSRHVKVVLPDPVADQLTELARGTGQPPATLASRMLQAGVAEAAIDGRVMSPRRARRLVARKRDERARWLEPYGGSASWRAEMWGAIVALHGRYPRALGTLKDGWWTDETHTETLCALATWRAEIDDTGEDPREELAFQAQLADYARALRGEGGGVTKAWSPGAPPTQWAER